MELPAAIILFVIFTAVIGTEGTRLSKTADQFADLTGLGEALVGGVLIGSIDSPAGAITSITAAYENHPELAISNAVGRYPCPDKISCSCRYQLQESKPRACSCILSESDAGYSSHDNRVYCRNTHDLGSREKGNVGS
ncbi:Sodium/calcium antiporter [Methanosarcina horonobensis HB-1 = JCM 15518]|uniref:Sodium/calcium antiporter n=1 Tax=Methanosarcina horonobensis HB-1 = JCM 15518 TaxID=1434110 RepID=A0A0E3S9N7_9EURY|nr:sodium/calcium exchanger protein [Methanosarcina horonobensis]AKB77436.1 Sodium/calcium antiporter [Methanosarcina horonobensis HB-1 = JCM 15518]